jgi:sortase B
MSAQDNKKDINIKALTIFIICVIIAVVAGSVFAIQLVGKSKQQSQYENLAEQTEKTATETSEPSKETEETAAEPELSSYEASIKALEELGVPIPDKEVDFETLQTETNADIYAWIYIPDTMIDYPVLQHPTDNSYYLNYNIDGSKGYPGCIYTENYNAKDFSDPVTVMYGHNMKSGAMFAGLHKFEDSEYFDEHQYIYIYTPDKLLVYEIFAAHIYGNQHILLNHNFESEYEVDAYLEEIEDTRSMKYNRREGVEVNSKSHILTLSTCVANQSDKRYLVQGVLLNED